MWVTTGSWAPLPDPVTKSSSPLTSPRNNSTVVSSPAVQKVIAEPSHGNELEKKLRVQRLKLESDTKNTIPTTVELKKECLSFSLDKQMCDVIEEQTGNNCDQPLQLKSHCKNPTTVMFNEGPAIFALDDPNCDAIEEQAPHLEDMEKNETNQQIPHLEDKVDITIDDCFDDVMKRANKPEGTVVPLDEQLRIDLQHARKESADLQERLYAERTNSEFLKVEMSCQQKNAEANMLMLQAQLDSCNAEGFLYTELRGQYLNLVAEVREVQEGRELMEESMAKNANNMKAELTEFEARCKIEENLAKNANNMMAEVTEYEARSRKQRAEFEEALTLAALTIQNKSIDPPIACDQQQNPEQHRNVMHEMVEVQSLPIESQFDEQRIGTTPEIQHDLKLSSSTMHDRNTVDDLTEEQPQKMPPSTVVASFWEGFRLLHDQVDAFEQFVDNT